VDNDDQRTELLYESATRVLDQQAATVDSVRVRAGILLSAASIATSFLAGIVVEPDAPRLGGFGWAAVGLFIAVVGLCLAILWPTQEWKFRPNARKLVRDYLDADPPASLAEMQRDLALHMENWSDKNIQKLRRLFLYFQAAALLLGVEVVVWMADLWG
jgi:hypothetical protein